MIIAEQMKQPMYEKNIELPQERVACLDSLSSCSWNGNDDIAQQGVADMRKLIVPEGKRQNVRALVFAAVSPVEGTHCPVANKENAQLGIRNSDAPQHFLESFHESRRGKLLFPLIVFYPDVHRVFFLRGNPFRDSQSGDGKCRSG